MRKDVLAAGYKSATFFPSVAEGDADLKNLSAEPRMDTTPVDIDRTRKVKRIVPKGEYILVQRREPENISAGGLLIPDEAKKNDRPAEGVVMSIGPLVQNLQPGDHIIFGQYSGTEYPWGVEFLLFMTESEVIATIED
jgi:chaperonin GroES